MAGRLALHVAVREPVKLFINERHQLVPGDLITVAPGIE
jgi:hypothetical protein